jgi:hypothetical protein
MVQNILENSVVTQVIINLLRFYGIGTYVIVLKKSHHWTQFRTS